MSLISIFYSLSIKLWIGWQQSTAFLLFAVSDQEQLQGLDGWCVYSRYVRLCACKWSVTIDVGMCVCVCVCEREREREISNITKTSL